MSIRSIILFLHIAGVLILFADLALEQVILRALRRANQRVQVSDWVNLWRTLPRADGVAALLVLATGVYLAVVERTHDGWIVMALFGMVAIGALGGAVTARRVRAIAKSIGEADAPLPSAVWRQVRDPSLATAAAYRLAIAVAIVFEMTTKPGTVAAVVWMAIAVAAGTVVARSLRQLTGEAELREASPGWR